MADEKQDVAADAKRVESGEHLTLSGSGINVRVPKSVVKSVFWKAVALLVTAGIPTVVGWYRGVTKDEAEKLAAAKAAEATKKVEQPTNEQAKELLKNQAEIARLAAIIALYEKNNVATAARAPRAQRRHADPEQAKNVETAQKDLAAISSRKVDAKALKVTTPPHTQSPPTPAPPTAPSGGTSPPVDAKP